MLIVIEGVDGTGKTELAQRLRQMIGYEDTVILHAGAPTRPMVEEYETPLKNYEPGSGDHIILDRWHLGEQVWPKIFRRKSPKVAEMRHVEMFMRSRGACYVHAWRDTDNLRETYSVQEKAGNPQPPELVEQVEHAFTLFDRAFASTGRPFEQWNFDICDEDNYVRSIVNSGTRAEFDVLQPYIETREWVGSPHPRALLVGERFGPRQDLEHAHVPFVPYPATAANYLLEALPSVMGGWRQFAVVNAYRGWSSEPHDLGRIQALLEDPVVVALGNEASKVLTDQDVPHEKVPHPQYWRRFKYSEQLEYGRMIVSAVTAQEEA